MFDIQEIDERSVAAGDPVAQIRMAVAALAGEDRDGWTGGALSQRLVEMLEMRERLDAELLRLAGSWDRNRAWEIDGSLSPRAWLTQRTPIGDGETQRLVKAGRLVYRHHTVAVALADGEITTPMSAH